MASLLLRLLREDRGQDLIEYALLTTFVGLVGIAAFDAIRSAIGTTYRSWNNSAYNVATPPDPGAGS